MGQNIINEFPGYEYLYPNGGKAPYSFRKGINMYKGRDLGHGGLVYAVPGMYTNVKVFDSASAHPHSLIAMNYFGEYTPRYEEILEARLAIKHKDFDKARTMLGGVLAPFLTDTSLSKDISQALKIVANSSYGLTSANFTNTMWHPDNGNNIVALRSALFLWDLKEMIESLGYLVISLKTDSIKVVNPPDNMLDVINDYAKDYGYSFEVEHSFDRICLVNQSVFIAKGASDDPDAPGKWMATGKQFKIPYVFKTLFSKEPITFDDLCETKEVKTAIYLDMNEGLPEGEHNYVFVGKVGQFCPIKDGHGGGELVAKRGDKFDAVEGTKGYRWLESETVKQLGKESDIDKNYYENLVEEAIASINEFGDFETFKD